ncbi:MAG: hypothetical protein NT049_01845 [Planctomycetota bacterium]|nr:hypothetical protein [Planctomycetota bacterium]
MAEPLVNSLCRIRRRLLVVRAAEAGLAGAIASAPVAAAVTGVRIVWPEAVPLAAAHPALPLALVACGFVLGFLVRLAMGVSLRQAAIAADHAAGLKERLATALEVLNNRRKNARGLEPYAVGLLPPSAEAPGLLDERLLAQATEAAAGLAPSRLKLSRTAGRSAKVLLAAVLVLVAAALVPPMGGPPVPAKAADRAAEALRSWAAEKPEAVNPEIREQIRRTLETLAEAGLRQTTADEATRAAAATAARVERGRKATLDELRKSGSPDVDAMTRAAADADTSGAVAAAEKAASHLAPLPGSPPAPEADRRRVADGLSGAAVVARREQLSKLADQLAAAADALRRADAEAARRALHELAERMAQDLGERPGAGAQNLIATIAEARRAMGLAELPGPVAVGGEVNISEYPATPVAGSELPANSNQSAGSVAEGQGAAAPVAGAAVKPEDRDVVRRYFGG